MSNLFSPFSKGNFNALPWSQTNTQHSLSFYFLATFLEVKTKVLALSPAFHLQEGKKINQNTLKPISFRRIVNPGLVPGDLG